MEAAYQSENIQKGITRQFVTGSANFVEEDRFDWTKLRGDYGLFALSYRLAAYGSERESGNALVYPTRLRIFECKFESGQGDTTYKLIDFEFLKGIAPQIGYVEKSTWLLRLPCLFVKHQLTYGGVVEIVPRASYPEVVVELWPDSLFTKFLTVNNERWQSIAVDTVKIVTKAISPPDSFSD